MDDDLQILEALMTNNWTASKTKLSLPIIGSTNNVWKKIWDKNKDVTGWLSEEEAFLLHNFARLYAKRNLDVVEIGSYMGRSTVAIGSAYLNTTTAFVHAVDPHTGDRSQVEAGKHVDTYNQFLENIEKCGVNSVIKTIRAKSVEASRDFRGGPIGLLFIDGWHDTDAALEDFLFWRKYLAEMPTIIFDDWTYPPVAKAIITIEKYLPPCKGFVGKDLVFTCLTQEEIGF